jgi:hypothetical protein
MINLSKALENNTALKWDVTKDPCSWKGVKCIPLGILPLPKSLYLGFPSPPQIFYLFFAR